MDELERPLFREIDPENLWERYDAQKILRGIPKHLLLILIVTLVFGALGLMGTYKLLNTYKAEALLLFQKEEIQRDIEGVFRLSNPKLDTALEMIETPHNLEVVRTILGLEIKEGVLKGMISVPIPKNESDLIKVSVKSGNPYLAVDIANTLAKVAVKGSQDLTRRQVQLALGSFESELAVVHEELAERMEEIERFKQERNPIKDEVEVELMRMQSKVRSAQKVRLEIAEATERMEVELGALPAQQVGFLKLLESKDVIQEKIVYLTKALEGARLMLNMPKGSLQLYQLAEKAKPKDSWWVELLPIFGMFFGLGCGLFLALLLEVCDNKLRTAQEIAIQYTIPCFLTIPELLFLTPGNAEKKSLFYIRRLAGRLEKVPGDRQTLAFASSCGGEGRSFLAEQAARYTQRLGKKVLLMKMGREDPERKSVGIEAFLREEASIDEIITQGRLDTITAEGKNGPLRELLQSERMGELMRELRERYDVIVIDTPAMMEQEIVPDLLAYADITLFVVGSPFTKKKILNGCLKDLGQLHIRPTGLILNMAQKIYIDDERIRNEMKRSRRKLWRSLLFWRRTR